MEINYSFIIPHKNCPDLLQRCINSIPEREDVQIIVVDDNSDDGKKPSLKERKNLHVILLNAQQSRGAGRARNVGLKYAEGKWLLFPDSDDYYNCGVLKVLDEYKDKGIDVLYFNFEYRHGIKNNVLPAFYFNEYFVKYDGSAEATKRLKFHHNVPWTKMVNHDFLRKNKISFEESPNGNDIYFSMKVGYCSNVINVEKRPLYVYLYYSNSIVNKNKSIVEAFCKLRHQIELNQFYCFINHREWNQSSILLFFQFTKRLGVSYFLYVISKTVTLLCHKKSLINFVRTIN